MNSRKLTELFALWSGLFLSETGRAVVLPGAREKLVELLTRLDDRTDSPSDLRQMASSLPDNAEITRDHPFNRAMLRFMIEHERQMPDQFRENVENIKRFFSP